MPHSLCWDLCWKEENFPLLWGYNYQTYNNFTIYISCQQKGLNLYQLLLSLCGNTIYSFKMARQVAPVPTEINGNTQSDSTVAGLDPQWITSFFLSRIFPCAFTQTHFQVTLLSSKTKQDFEQLKISLQSSSEAIGDLLGQKMPRTKYMFGPTWGNSLSWGQQAKILGMCLDFIEINTMDSGWGHECSTEKGCIVTPVSH